MKKSLVLTIFGAAAIVTASHGQGTVTFQNYFGSTSPRITYDNSADAVKAGKAGLAVGGSFAAELFWFNGVTSDPLQLTGIASSITGFGIVLGPGFPNATADGDAAYGAGWFLGPTLSLAGAPVGSTVTLKIVAFNGSSGFNGANTTLEGSSVLFQRTLGGGALPPASLQGFPNFVIPYTPEPSTFALSIVGAASLIAFRRKRVS